MGCFVLKDINTVIHYKMNKMINRFLLTGKFMFYVHKVLVDHLLKTKRESENLKKQEIQNTFIKTNCTNSALSMIWLMVI